MYTLSVPLRELGYVFNAGLCVTALVWDLRTRRIPNLLILTGLIVNVLLVLLQRNGFVGGWWSFLGNAGAGLLVPLILFPLFMVRALGAGDIKLLMVLGLTLGLTHSFYNTMAMLVFGGVLALGVFCYHLGARGVRGLIATRGAGIRDYPQMKITFPFSGAILLGYLWVLWFLVL